MGVSILAFVRSLDRRFPLTALALSSFEALFLAAVFVLSLLD